MTAAAGPAQAGQVRRGILLVLAAAACYGFGPPLTRLAYDDGATPVTVLAVRFLAMILMLALILSIGRRSPWLPAGRRIGLIGLGVIFGGVGASYLTAVRFIPVSLAVLLFFTYPLLTILLARVIHGEVLTRTRMAAFVAAFLGVALAIGPELARLDPVGVGLGLVAACCCALTLTLNGRVRAGLDGWASQLWLMLPGALFFTIAFLAQGGDGFPRGPAGWLGVGGAVASFLGGTACFFAAIPRAGTIRVALFGNLEPVVTLVAAPIMLGEVLGPAQIAGASLVVGAILTLPLVEGRRKKALATPDLVA